MMGGQLINNLHTYLYTILCSTFKTPGDENNTYACSQQIVYCLRCRFVKAPIHTLLQDLPTNVSNIGEKEYGIGQDILSCLKVSFNL